MEINNNLNKLRLLLTKLRNGDYSHPGEEEANDIVIQLALHFDLGKKDKPTLDVGCGFGGTAYYFHQNAI